MRGHSSNGFKELKDESKKDLKWLLGVFGTAAVLVLGAIGTSFVLTSSQQTEVLKEVKTLATDIAVIKASVATPSPPPSTPKKN